MIQNSLLAFIDSNNNNEENFQNLFMLLKDQEIQENKNELKSFFHLILKISNNHHRSPNFFDKIERILIQYKDEMKNYFSNFEIFSIFKSNKRILLFLLQEQMLTMDKTIYDIMLDHTLSQYQYALYFAKETHPFLVNEVKSDDYQIDDMQSFHGFLLLMKSTLDDSVKKPSSLNLPIDYEENRKRGENDQYFCQLIREDSMKEFVSYINEKKISVRTIMNPSMYETNSLLISSPTSLIEYAAFFGSFEIFKFLFLCGIALKSSIWIYAIHGNNPEIIHFLEEKNIHPANKKPLFDDFIKLVNGDIKSYDNFDEQDYSDEDYDMIDEDFDERVTYIRCFKEAIKCNHNDIANYILEKYIKKEEILQENENKFRGNVNDYCFHYYNYTFFPLDLNQKFIIFYASQYDYFNIVKFLLANQNIALKVIVVIINLFFLNDIFNCQKI